VLDPASVEFFPSEDHHRPFETKVRDRDKALFFTTFTADDQNTLITRMDAARRLKMASVSLQGTVFRDERSTLIMSHPVQGEGQKVFTWGLGAMLGVTFGQGEVDAMAVPQCVSTLFSS